MHCLSHFCDNKISAKLNLCLWVCYRGWVRPSSSTSRLYVISLQRSARRRLSTSSTACDDVWQTSRRRRVHQLQPSTIPHHLQPQQLAVCFETLAPDQQACNLSTPYCSLTYSWSTNTKQPIATGYYISPDSNKLVNATPVCQLFLPLYRTIVNISVNIYDISSNN